MPEVNFKINPALKPLWDKVQDKKSLYGALASVGMNAIEKNFETEGARTGEKWEALKASTIKARSKKRLWPGKILQARGTFAKSIHAYSTSNAAMWGSNLKYVRTHVEGLTINYPGSHNRAAASFILFFRRLTRGKGKGGVRFANEKKASFAQKILRGAHSYTFPVRNPLQFTKEDFDNMNKVLTKLLT